MAGATNRRGEYLLMEDRKNDWLARQLEEERQAQARIMNMFGIRYNPKDQHTLSGDARAVKNNHAANCDARDVKERHAANCDARAVKNAYSRGGTP